MTQTIHNRAKVGGEQGMNGEWYEGGQFLPSTMLPKGFQIISKKGSGKQEIQPYDYQIAPAENLRSIYKSIEMLVNIKHGEMIITASQQTINYYEVDVDKLQSLVDLWSDGERWMAV